MHPPLSAGRGGGVEAPTEFSKRGGLDRFSVLRGGCWEKGDGFFQGEELQFFHKK